MDFNITITVNDDKEIKVEQDSKVIETKMDGVKNIKQPLIKLLQPITMGRKIHIYEFELANHLLLKGYQIAEIKPSDKSTEGLVFTFHHTTNIRNVMKKWNRKRNEALEEIAKTQTIDNTNLDNEVK